MIQDKAQSAGNGMSFTRDCNAVLDHLDGSESINITLTEYQLRIYQKGAAQALRHVVAASDRKADTRFGSQPGHGPCAL